LFNTNDGKNKNRSIHTKSSIHESNISDKIFEVIFNDNGTYQATMYQVDIRSILEHKVHSNTISKEIPYNKDCYTLYGWCYMKP
jgi:hypothetical protein